MLTSVIRKKDVLPCFNSFKLTSGIDIDDAKRALLRKQSVAEITYRQSIVSGNHNRLSYILIRDNYIDRVAFGDLSNKHVVSQFTTSSNTNNEE